MDRCKQFAFSYPPSGPAGPGSFPDHNYNSQMRPHCPPGGYQPYMNGPYPVTNSRTHHYSSQHLQQGPPNHLPYRANYGPPPSQYIPPPLPPNQEMYRNHHPGFVGNSTRTYHGKGGWVESSSGDMMPTYNHGPSHPQMINNSGPMNVSSMRSPPHIPSAVNPVPSPGSQHYRQMQSPGHSPQTWPQVQVPSPGMHPVARTTPSPLQSHARSPGHSQPFSPSAPAHMAGSVNLPSHPIPSVVPENQSGPLVGQGMTGIMPTGPLHSLQKMVMLEQDTDSMQMNCELSNENSCDPVPVCRSNSVAPEDQNSEEEETKDSSSFATYYNLDENRLESKPQTDTAFKDSSYDINMPVREVPSSPQSLISNPDDQSSDISQMSKAAVQCSQSYDIPQTTHNTKSNSPNSLSNGSSKNLPPTLPAENHQEIAANLSNCKKSDGEDESSHGISDEGASNPKNNDLLNVNNIESASTETSNSENSSEVQCDNKSVLEAESKCRAPGNEMISGTPAEVGQESSSDTSPPSVLSVQDHEVTSNIPKSVEESQPENAVAQELTSVSGPNVEKLQLVNHSLPQEADNPSEQITVKMCHDTVNVTVANDVGKPKFVAVNAKTIRKAVSTAVLSTSTITSTETVSYNPNKLINIGKNRISTSEIARNPVKVVIHRIRTNSTNDTWHVPNSNGSTVVESLESTPRPVSGDNEVGDNSRTSKIGPQIIILSPAMSRKKFGLNAADNQKAIVKEEVNSEITENSSSTNSQPAPQTTKKTKKGGVGVVESRAVKQSPNSVAKKKGRTLNAAAKPRSASAKRKRKGKQKDIKLARKKMNIEEVELPPKPKKLKPFAGPYIHLIGSKSCPSSITVVNMAIREEEKGKNLRPKPTESSIKRPRVGHISTLSPHYDAFNKDRTWLCAFCHKGSHCHGLGDLYGPYYIKDDGTLPSLPNPGLISPVSSRGSRSKRRKSDASIPESPKIPRKSPKLATKMIEPQETTEAIPSPVVEQTLSDDTPVTREVWIHEDCAVWCQSVSLMGSQIYGLEEAIQEAYKNVCSSCKFNGATLGCWCKGCAEQYHFICAKEKGCKLNIENFSLFCSKHKDVKYVTKEKTS